MQVRDVVTRNVISVGPHEPLLQAARLMLQNKKISGLPVVDAAGNLVGIVTEGDFLRRGEIGTQRRRPKWLEFLVGRAGSPPNTCMPPAEKSMKS